MGLLESHVDVAEALTVLLDVVGRDAANAYLEQTPHVVLHHVANEEHLELIDALPDSLLHLVRRAFLLDALVNPILYDDLL